MFVHWSGFLQKSAHSYWKTKERAGFLSRILEIKCTTENRDGLSKTQVDEN